MDLKPIETIYKGVTFRSRLEARWAVFFDQLGIRWLYEHEGYETPHGRYVPDFWLPDMSLRSDPPPGILLEVKPRNYRRQDHPRLEYVAEKLNVGGILARGFEITEHGFWNELIQVMPGWDTPMFIYACPCGHAKFEYSEGNYYDCPKCKRDGKPNDIDARARTAYGAALAHRFW